MTASRLFLSEVESCIIKKNDFAIETTLAGRSYLKLIKRLQLANWEIKLIFLALPNVEMSKKRVAERVLHGGHNIPNKDIERRYPRSLNNFLNKFSHIVDSCICFMNLGKKPELIFQQHSNNRTIVNKQ